VPGLYAVLTALGRLDFELIHRLRRLDGLPGHPDVAATPEVVTSTGSLGMGVSKARGFVLADRLLDRDGRVYVLTGDGRASGGAVLGVAPADGEPGLGEITVIVDRNGVQSDTWVSQVSDLGDLRRSCACSAGRSRAATGTTCGARRGARARSTATRPQA
jgi:transketolase